MPELCLYFQLHQPYRLGDFDTFQLGSHDNYFADKSNSNYQIFQKVANKSYRPMLQLLLHLSKSYPDFRFALSASGLFLRQAEEYAPDIIKLIRKLLKTGKLELLAETYYHSLSSLFSQKEFKKQVSMHLALLERLFDYVPVVFRNTELVYSNHIAWQVQNMGFMGILTEAVPRYLHGREKTKIYRSKSEPGLPILLKHAEFSDDIAFRFSDKNWKEFPLEAEKYLYWLSQYGGTDVINLFMDFETFGEHQWEETGIFSFFEKLVAEVVHRPSYSFVSPSEKLLSVGQPLRKGFRTVLEKRRQLIHQAAERHEKVDGSIEELPIYDVPEPISWADVDRDLTAWLDNDLQQDVIRILYELEPLVLQSKDEQLIDDWRSLQCSDHLYYMCTKWAADGDVHAYFSPYDSPLEAYRKYAIVLSDLRFRVQKVLH